MNPQSHSESSSDAADTSNARIDMNLTSDFTSASSERQDANADPGLPFQLLLVSDLTPQTTPAEWDDGDHRHSMSDKSVADLIAELTPQLSIEVPNTISDDPDAWTVDLSFPTLTSFEPDQIARQLDLTSQLLEIRNLVQNAADGTLDADAFQKQVRDLGLDIDWTDDLYRLLTAEGESSASSSSAPPSDSTGSGDSLGRVMDMVDTDEDDSAAPQPNDSEEEPSLPDLSDQTFDDAGPAGALAAALQTSRAAADDTSAAEHIVRQLTEALRTQVEAVLTHPEVRRLEAAWRGLDFLTDRLPLDANVDLLVLPAGRDDLHEAMHHQVLMPEHDDANDDPPTSLVLVDQAFGRTNVDFDQLTDLAGTGESLQAPVVASVDPDFFGIENFKGLRKLPTLRPHLQGSEYVRWDRLREEEASAFLGLALPSVLLRAPHTNNGSALELDEEQGLYGSSALAVGVAAARSFADTGWATHLDDYPIESIQAPDGPLAARFSGSMQSELARAGFVVLDETEDGSAIQVEHASSVREPGSYDDPSAAAEARMELTLPCRLFAGRAAHHLFEIKQELDLNRPLDAICEDVSEAMASALDVPPSEAVAQTAADSASEADAEEHPADDDTADSDSSLPPILVEEAENVDLPNQDVLAVRLRPPNDILTPNARLAMVLRVPSGS